MTDFPYRQPEDDLVSRRELLKLAVYNSGALFACTAALAAMGSSREPARGERKAIARASEVPEGGVVYFAYPREDDQAMLLRLAGGALVAFSQKCTHLSCSVYYQPERERLYCPCHEGVFNVATGDPVAGPPARRLPRILVEQDGDTIYATGWMP